MHQGSASENRSSDGSSLELNAYAKVDAYQWTERNTRRTPVMVRIRSRTVKQRGPVDIVLVLHVHVRYTAPAKWHDLMNKATELVVEKLGDNDRLAIVPSLSKETRIIFEDAVIVPVKPKLLPMSSENKAAACTAVKSSEAMRSNTPLVRDLESAESILYRRDSKEKERAGHIIVISNSNEDLSSMLTWRFHSVQAFGFRGAHNARAMYTIASSGDSTYAILDDKDDKISPAFVANIDKITSAIEPLEVHLMCNQEVILSTIHAPRICYSMSDDKKTGVIWANARCDKATNFIIYLDIPAHYHEENEYSNLLTIQVKYGRPRTSVTGPPLVTVRKGEKNSKEVAAEMVRMEAVKIVAEITAEDKKGGDEELHGVAELLRNRWTDVRESGYGKEAAEAGFTSSLIVEMEEMEKRLRNNDLWLDCMLFWRSQQWWPCPPLVKDDINGGRSCWTYSREGIQYPEPLQEATSHPFLRLRTLLAKEDALPVQMQRSSQRGVPVLVHIAVLPVEGLEEKRAPVDLVAVLDVSCRVQETKTKRMKLLDKAMGFTMEKLSHVDRLAIIPVPSTITEHDLIEMTENGRSHYRKMLSDLASASMDAEQTSNERQPLKKPTCIPITTVKASGTPARGSNDLSKSMKHAVKLLDDRPADNNDNRMGMIIVISDRDDISIRKRTLRSKYTIHAFSFRGANNTRAMHRMASSSSGIYALLHNRGDEMTTAFKSSISKITSIVAVNTRVNLSCTHNSHLRLSSIESGRFKSSIDRLRKSVSISAGAIYPGASRRFITYLDNVREDSYYHLPMMLKVNMTWRHASNGAEEKLDGRVVIVRDKPSSNEVVQELVRIEGLKIVRSITNPKTEIDTVFRRVQELRKRLRVRASYVGVRQPKASSSSVTMDVDDHCLASLVTAMDQSPLSYMLSWLSFEGLCENLPSGTG